MNEDHLHRPTRRFRALTAGVTFLPMLISSTAGIRQISPMHFEVRALWLPILQS
jgi:hypothetical protein